MATGDETHTTRARANALRVALSNRGLLDGLADPALDEVMDLCIGCKGCKTECPTGVDMARLKSEYLAHRNLTRGVSRRSRWIADFPARLPALSRLPTLANLISQSTWVRSWLERKLGLDRRLRPPRLAPRTFRAWFRRHSRRRAALPASRGRVVYLVDTWANFFTPTVGVAAVQLLERAGYEVICPVTYCCGRPAISQGMLIEARHAAELNVRILGPYASAGIPIVGTEPSCTLTLVDEYPQLARSEAARRVAAATALIEAFLVRLLEAEPAALTFRSPDRPILFHAHCHQKALVGTAGTLALLRRAWGQRAGEINSGCCGMAGAFGHEVEHYEIAQAIGEQRLFPAVRGRGEADVAVSGFSCRTQIAHHAGYAPRHWLELLSELLE
jgi:Fe-S oxidoreductase